MLFLSNILILFAGEKAIGKSGKVLVDFMIVISQIGEHINQVAYTYLVVFGCGEQCLVVVGSAWLWWAVLGCGGRCLVVVGGAWLWWAVLGWEGWAVLGWGGWCLVGVGGAWLGWAVLGWG